MNCLGKGDAFVFGLLEPNAGNRQEVFLFWKSLLFYVLYFVTDQSGRQLFSVSQNLKVTEVPFLTWLVYAIR